MAELMSGDSFQHSEKEAALQKNVSVTRWDNNITSETTDILAEEVAVALVFNGISHAVMMASPNDLFDFALGFSLTEGIIKSSSDIYEFDCVILDDGLELQLTIASRRMTTLKEKRRSLVGVTGCGICGSESIEQVMRPVKKIRNNALNVTNTIRDQAIQTAVAMLEQHQPLQNQTGAHHGAAWCNLQGEIILIREDVGRHNALDKLIGAMHHLNINIAEGFVLVSSRAIYEMVQKIAVSSISALVSVSAPTALALRIAKLANIQLIGFARPNRHVHYNITKSTI
jgi:FdhD protein